MNNKFPLYLVLIIALSGTAGAVFADAVNSKTNTFSDQQKSLDLPEIVTRDSNESISAGENRQSRTEVGIQRGAFGDDELDWVPSSWYSAY